MQCWLRKIGWCIMYLSVNIKISSFTISKWLKKWKILYSKSLPKLAKKQKKKSFQKTLKHELWNKIMFKLLTLPFYGMMGSLYSIGKYAFSITDRLLLILGSLIKDGR